MWALVYISLLAPIDLRNVPVLSINTAEYCCYDTQIAKTIPTNYLFPAIFVKNVQHYHWITHHPKPEITSYHRSKQINNRWNVVWCGAHGLAPIVMHHLSHISTEPTTPAIPPVSTFSNASKMVMGTLFIYYLSKKWFGNRHLKVTAVEC